MKNQAVGRRGGERPAGSMPFLFPADVAEVLSLSFTATQPCSDSGEGRLSRGPPAPDLGSYHQGHRRGALAGGADSHRARGSAEWL